MAAAHSECFPTSVSGVMVSATRSLLLTPVPVRTWPACITPVLAAVRLTGSETGLLPAEIELLAQPRADGHDAPPSNGVTGSVIGETPWATRAGVVLLLLSNMGILRSVDWERLQP